MATIAYRWHAMPGKPYEIGLGIEPAAGTHHCAARWVDTGEVFAGASADTLQDARDGVFGVLAFAVAARKITSRRPATEPTPAGLQYVMPGCEKDQTRGPSQMSLF